MRRVITVVLVTVTVLAAGVPSATAAGDGSTPVEDEPALARAFPAARADSVGSISIVVDSGGAAQDFWFTGCGGLGCGSFALDDDGDPSLPDRVDFSGIAAGTYVVEQDIPPGWALTGLVCDTGESVDRGTGRVTITLSAGEHATCTFTNTAVGTISIVVDSGGAAQDFAFTGCGGLGCGSFALDDDGDPSLPDRVDFSGIAAGTYVVEQDVPPGWALTGLVCDTGESVDLSARRATITLDGGEHATCTFTDTAEPNPIVFVHGWNGSTGTWNTMRNRFAADGVAAGRLHAFSYDSNQSNRTSARQLRTYVQGVLAQHPGATRVDLISHSMGSMVTRWCIKFEGCGDLVDDDVSLAGVGHGTLWATFCFWSTACEEMRSGSGFLAELNSGDETPGSVTYTTYRSTCDEVIIPSTSTELAGATNHVLPDCLFHNDLPGNRWVYDSLRPVVLDG